MSTEKIEMVQRERASSVGGLTDWVQRRGGREMNRAEQGVGENTGREAFEKSNKVERSPARRKRKVEQTLNAEGEGESSKEIEKEEVKNIPVEAMFIEILNRMKIIEAQNKKREEDKEEIKEEIRTLAEEFNKKHDSLQRELNEVRTELKESQQKIVEMEEKINLKNNEERKNQEDPHTERRLRELEMIQEKRERAERRCNIMIKGADINKVENKEMEIKKILKQLTGKDTEVGKIQEITGAEGKIMLIQMKSWIEKKELMRKKSSLKGTEIYIDDDLTKKERHVQKKIRDIVRTERESGKQAKMGYMKIQINGKWRRWNEFKEEFEDMVDFRFGMRK